MDPLLSTVETFARRHALFRPGSAVVVGVSGGPDSLCLLHIMSRIASEYPLHLYVAHLHHGLRGADADADARFVQAFARELGLPHVDGRIDVQALAAREGRSVEEAARQARYAFLRDVALDAGAGVIAVGHNADDQAETVLMHFLRGSGVSGLRGMLPRTPLTDYRLVSGEGDAVASPVTQLWLVRPLLQVGRDRIVAYCVAHGLAPRFDRSNEDTTYFRNRLRHELLPVLETYNPAFRKVLTHTAEVMAGDAEVLRERVEAAWEQAALLAESHEVRLDLAVWRSLPIGLQRAVLREAVHRLRRSLRDINWEHIEQAARLAKDGHTGQSATLPAGLVLELDYNCLRIAPADAARPATTPRLASPVHLIVPGVTPIEDGWRVVIERSDAPELPLAPGDEPWQAWLDADATGAELSLRSRLPGDRFEPQGMAGHSMSLSEFMINAKVPRADREGWPLLIGRQGIAWVCGLRVDERAVVTTGSTRVWRVRLER
jgi:tRNA(Ile)-lysidine synthase